MKKYLLLASLLALAAVCTAEAQSRTFTAASSAQRRDRLQRRAPQAYPRAPIGALPRAARGGNPLQLLNPRAPQKYFGPPQDTVVYDTANYEANRHPQVSGLILFGLTW